MRIFVDLKECRYVLLNAGGLRACVGYVYVRAVLANMCVFCICVQVTLCVLICVHSVHMCWDLFRLLIRDVTLVNLCSLCATA